MTASVSKHYATGGSLAELVFERLRDEGKNLAELSTADLAPIDEFHIRGRKATLELARWIGPGADDHLLDIGSGLGGPARTLAETCGWDTLVLSDHLVNPDQIESRYPYNEDGSRMWNHSTPWPDVWVSTGAMAASVYSARFGSRAIFHSW